jgi:hypothetical protein
MSTRAARDLTALRRSSLLLGMQSERTPAEVVRWMLAMQGQDFPGVKWSVGLRSPGSTDAAIEAALASGEIVRSWPMRGTLHLVAPEDLGWMLAIGRPRMATTTATRRANLGITDRDLGIVTDTARQRLAGGGITRRDDLLAAFESAGVPTTGQRGYHLLFHLALHGVLVFGPVDGKHQTFALLDEWVTAPRALEADEALAEFAGRYFRSHGPATDRDFAWWANITLGDARKGIALAGLESREFDSVTHYFSPGLEPAPEFAHVLPGFDEYLLGYQNRSGVLAAEYSNRIVPGNNGIFLPTLVLEGQVVGTWRRTQRAARVDIELLPFTSIAQRGRIRLERAFDRFAEFIGKPVVLRWAP